MRARRCAEQTRKGVLAVVVEIVLAAEEDHLVLEQRGVDRCHGVGTQVVPDAELADRARALAQQMATTSRTSNAAVKRLLLDTFATGIEEQMELEARAIAECATAADGQEGIAAFLGKRAPTFG